MKVLVIGQGGREHALAWHISQSKRVSKIFVAPGNAGTAQQPHLTNIKLNTSAELIEFAKQEKISLTIVGPEGPLALGIVDDFQAQGLKIFGPTRYAAQLESSKNFAKAFMLRHGIPTAPYQSFDQAKPAHAYVDQQGVPIVIKADGLAAGKGVVVAQSLQEAHQTIDAFLIENKIGSAGKRLLIEKYLEGEEASFIVMVDGEHVLALATSQDHKRLCDHDEGPNTGGMGAYSPALVVTPEIHARVMREIILPTVRAMKQEGHPYTGFLYAGLMIDHTGQPHTIEFNCRLGDPEAQVIIARLKTDLTLLIEHAIKGTLDRIEAHWDRRTALGVVLTTEGYPREARVGDFINGLPPDTEESIVFHAGTVLDSSNRLLTSGGRVLCAVGLGDSLRIAQSRAYSVADRIQFAGKHVRRDIGFPRKTPFSP